MTEINLKNIITEQQCKTVLKERLKTDKFTLINYQIRAISATTQGYLGEHFFLNCDVQLKEAKQIKTVTFFVKQRSECNNDLTKTIEKYMIKFYDKEAKLYEIINNYECDDSRNPWIPKLYGYFDKKLLIFDNLMDKGFKQIERTQFDLEHCKQVLKTLAKLHAFSLQWTNAQNTNNPIMNYEFLTEITFTKSTLNERLFFYPSIQSIYYIIELLTNSKLTSAQLKERTNMKIDKILEQAQPSKKFPNVITHGDLWENNILFQYDERGHVTNCCFVDFQLVKFTPPAVDLLFFLYQNTTFEFQQKYRQTLIQYYYDQLAERVGKYNLNLEEIFPKTDFILSIQEYNASWKIIAFIYVIVGSIKKEILHEMLATDRDRIDLLIGDRVSYIKRAISTDPEYKDKLLVLSKEIHEILIDDRIFRENCYEILNKKLRMTNYKLNEFSLQPLSTRVGYLGDHQILNMQVEIDRNVIRNFEFFVKFLPKEQTQRKTLLEWQGFEREVLYYEVIFEKMKQLNINIIPDVVPEMYLAIKNYVLVLDDLTKDNYRMCDKYKQLDLLHIKCVLKTLAKFHAASIIFEEKLSENNEKFHICNIAPNIFTEPIFRSEAILNGGIDCIQIIYEKYFPEYQIENFPEKLIKLKSKFISVIKRSEKYPNVLCHGDLWSNNVLFQYNDRNEVINCRLVDFQLGRYTTQAHDVITALYLMTNKDLFKEYHRSLLKEYYTEFSAILETYQIDSDNIINYESFLTSCDDVIIFGLLQKAIFYQYIMMSPKCAEIYIANKEKSECLMEGYRYEMINDNWQDSMVYRQLIADSHIPIFEYCQNLTL